MEQTVTAVADRLYGLSYRPQELALYGERVTFDLRWSPIPDDEGQATTSHFLLLVLEVRTEIQADDELGRSGGSKDLLKIGWELELRSSQPLTVEQLPQDPQHLRLALSRVADCVNDLARRAGLEAPLGPEVVDSLLAGAIAQ